MDSAAISSWRSFFTHPEKDWLVEESDAGDYSQLDVRVLGFQTNRSVCTNADDSGAGKSTSLPQFLAINRSQLTRLITQHLLPKVRGGAATTDIVILDLESPRGIHPRGYGELNDTMLAAVVRATRLPHRQLGIAPNCLSCRTICAAHRDRPTIRQSIGVTDRL